jgi:hypothetical protein
VEHELDAAAHEPTAAPAAVPEAGATLQPTVEHILRLQATAGNRMTGVVLQRMRAERQTVQRGVFSALGKGLGVYTGIPDTDPGKKFAQELIRWRVLGAGSDFIKRGHADSDWNEFMLARPEIQRAMVPVFKEIAQDEAAKGPSGGEWTGGYRKISTSITGVRLDELESMRLTLHGCHRIDIKGRVHVADDGANRVVKIWPQMTWIDVADLHPGTTTELDSGKSVDDKEFSAAGWDYKIWIMFEPFGSVFAPDVSSKWRVSGGTATHEAGWPPEGSVPQGGRRG